MSEVNGIQIAAGGYGTRLREFMTDAGYEPGFPKHLLPTGASNGETFLGRIVRQGLEVETNEPITVYANAENKQHIIDHPDVDQSVQVATDVFSQSLEPFFAKLLRSGERVLACAGDFYADFEWARVLDHHESSKFPATFMVGNTVAVEKGAAFDVADNGQITSLGRPERSSGVESINVGVYVFEPHKEVIGILERHLRSGQSRDDQIVQEFIAAGLAGAYLAPGMPFNVNTPETYQALLDHTASLEQVS